MLWVFFLLALSPSVLGFMEENEGIILPERDCEDLEEKSIQTCKNSVTVLSAAFASIQAQHEDFSANDHININKNCQSSLACLKTSVGCFGITQEDVDLLKKKCDYMEYLTGAFYACSQKLRLRKGDSDCVKNFFDDQETLGTPKETICSDWSKNRACLKWTIRDACSRSYWKQYKPYWHMRYSLLKCD